MKYIAAYMLAKLGGKEEPAFEDIKRIIESIGIEINENKINELISKLSGKNINEIMNEGKSKLSIISNDQTAQQNENENANQGENEQLNEQNEEETLELGLGDDFDNLFN